MNGSGRVDRVSDMTYLKLQALQRGEKSTIGAMFGPKGSRLVLEQRRVVNGGFDLFCANRSRPTHGCNVVGL